MTIGMYHKRNATFALPSKPPCEEVCRSQLRGIWEHRFDIVRVAESGCSWRQVVQAIMAVPQYGGTGGIFCINCEYFHMRKRRCNTFQHIPEKKRITLLQNFSSRRFPSQRACRRPFEDTVVLHLEQCNWSLGETLWIAVWLSKAEGLWLDFPIWCRCFHHVPVSRRDVKHDLTQRCSIPCRGSWDNQCHDVNEWCPVGPGARRGLNRLHGRPTKQNCYSSKLWVFSSTFAMVCYHVFRIF